ncbi:MAG TPA: HAD-IA family hydrolase [Bryobacteraceae bacterium]|nr:HAD-IA family hydrolase [Bryobacteraceae bacterium]
MNRPSRRQILGAMAAGAASGAVTAQAAETRPLPLKLVVLDIGGTIVEERGDIPAVLGSAFSKRGITVTAAEINEWRGASKREIVRHFVELRAHAAEAERKTLIESIYGDFSARIIEAYRTVKPIEGAEDAFQEMRSRGLLLATSTGFDGPITASIMRRLGWEHYFTAMITSDDVVQGRPSPYMLFHAMEAARVDCVSQVVAVGDTPLDLQAANNAGLRGVVGVLSGVGTGKTMEPEPHTDLLNSVAELPALLRAKY